MVSGFFFSEKLIKTMPGMLYIVGQVFLYGKSFNIIYNELGHKIMNMKFFEYRFLLQSSIKNINHLKTEMEAHDPAMCCHTHIYLSNRYLQIQIIC